MTEEGVSWQPLVSWRALASSSLPDDRPFAGVSAISEAQKIPLITPRVYSIPVAWMAASRECSSSLI